MNRRHFLKAMGSLALCPTCGGAAFAAEGAHWSYEGHSGPAHWGEIDATSRVCSLGGQQSPLDLTGSITAKLPPLQLHWTKRPSAIVNNGHTIQLNFPDGNTLATGKRSYSLLQVHFHRPSEHLIEGRNFPMEAHFVHRDAAGNLAVVGVMMAAGKSNPAFRKIVQGMPAEKGEKPADPGIDVNALLPAARRYFRYTGSLTTPPCSEVVDWNVLATPVEVAEAEIAAFARLYPMNARPPQKPNRRFVLRSQ